MEKFDTIYRFKTEYGERLLVEGIVEGVRLTIDSIASIADARSVLLSWEQWYAFRYLPVYRPEQEAAILNAFAEEPSDESPAS
jgi:hypothetical protein